MNIRNLIAKFLVPSTWVEWLNGKKRLLGVISLALWAIIIALPAICHSAICQTVSSGGIQIQAFLTMLGVNLDTVLLDAGAALTVIGLLDWIVNHWFSKVVTGILRYIEEPLKKLAEKGSQAPKAPGPTAPQK